jgi:hypothetical protein
VINVLATLDLVCRKYTVKEVLFKVKLKIQKKPAAVTVEVEREQVLVHSRQKKTIIVKLFIYSNNSLKSQCIWTMISDGNS